MANHDIAMNPQELRIPGRGPVAGLLSPAGARAWSLTFSLVTALVCLVTTMWYFSAIRDGFPASWPRTFFKVGFEWYPWAFFGPLISLLVKKHPFDRARIVQAGLIHLAAATVVAIIQNGSAVLGASLVKAEPMTFAGYYKEFVTYFLWMAPWSVVIYFGIAALVSAFDFRSRWLQREWLASRLETELTRAQLNTLYSQLQPHFLFNTLNSISVLVESDRSQEAQTVLNRLSELLRYVLARGGTQLVPVEDEVAFVEKYLAIEQIRYAERLRYRLEVSPEARTAKVPTFLLQTLVENAVRHGLSPKLAGGEVEVRISVVSERLRIEVRDDGVGLTGKSTGGSTTGVGLINTRSRLDKLFAGDYRLDLVPTTNGGTLAQVDIPLRSD